MLEFLCLFCSFYATGGIEVHEQPRSANRYFHTSDMHWVLDTNEVDNPYGYLALGAELYSHKGKKFEFEVDGELRHGSSIPSQDYGVNAAGVYGTIRWRR